MEIENRAKSKKDFIADSRELKVVPGNGDYEDWKSIDIEVGEQGCYPLTDHAHSQISGFTNVPLKYYHRMKEESPNLLALNVNHWLKENPKRRMVRTLERPVDLGQMPGLAPTSENLPVVRSARAFLSDRYRIMDNEEILESTLPVIGSIGQCKIVSCDVTDTRLWLKVVFPWIEAEVEHKGKKVGDVVQAGFTLGNSEIGMGKTFVDPLLYRLSCLNGARMRDNGLSKYHVGRILGEGKDAHQYFKDDTLKADDEAFLLKLRDVIKAAADEVQFKLLVDKMSQATENEIAADPVKAIEVVQKKFGFTDEERGGVLRHLIQGGELTQYGLSNAITRTSQDAGDYDRASDMERMGGQVIELHPSEWKVIAKAA
jgi:hypothetical protein